MDIELLIQIIPKITKCWTEDEVMIWLSLIGLPQLAQLFKSHKIDGLKLLCLNYQYLYERMKIKSKIIKKKILSWIVYLREKEDFISSKLINKQQSKFQVCSLPMLCMNTSEVTTKKQQSQENQDEVKSETKTRRNSSFEDFKGSQSCGHHQILYVYQRPLNQNKFIICQGQNITFGKSISNDFTVFLTDILPFHCQIIHQNGRHYLDFDPNGTVWKNIQTRIKLEDEQVYEMGESILFISVEGSCLRLMLASTYNTHHTFTFFGEQINKVRIGRRNICEIAIPYDRTMSALHGKFSYQQKSWYFQDFQTTNGTWIKCQQRQLIIDRLIFRLGRNSNLFYCKIQQQDDVSQTNSILSVQRCKYCKSNEKNSYYRPCSHHCSCYECGIQNSHCQICSQEISQVIKIYK